jgi:ATP-dependent RNA helicase DDX54/DBP10
MDLDEELALANLDALGGGLATLEHVMKQQRARKNKRARSKSPAEPAAKRVAEQAPEDDDDDDDEVEDDEDVKELEAAASKARDVITGTVVGGKAGGKSSGGTFATLGLSQPVLAGVLKMGYRLPTPIQRKTLPLTLGGRDVVAMARTGSGKTAAFLLPVIEKLQSHVATSGGPRSVILSPTREIAQQTLKFARGLGRFTDLRCALLVGGDSMEAQFEALATNPDILIATPGRLMHLLAEVRDFSLARVEVLVFDEADRLFELGFAEQLQHVLTKCPEQRQTLLFSATLPRMLVQFARAGLKEPELLRLDVDSKVSDKLSLAFLRVRTEERETCLLWLLEEVVPADQQAMVFVATRHDVELYASLLRHAGVTVDAVYGQMDADARKASIGKFRARRTRVLVATDVAARGIDLPLLDNVINVHFPDKVKLFIHRCGRVARQGKAGCAFSIVTPREAPYMVDVFGYLNRPLSSSREETRLLREQEEAALREDGFGSEEPPAKRVSPPQVGDMEEGYSLAEMAPEDVHYGSVPRALLSGYIDAITRWEQSAGGFEAAALRKASNNGAQQYNKNKAEASRSGIAASKRLNEGVVHPLALAHGGALIAQQEAASSSLTSFRPNSTVFELEGGRHAAARQQKAASAMQSLRRVHRGLLARDAAKVAASTRAAAVAMGFGESEQDAADAPVGGEAEDLSVPGATAIPSKGQVRISAAERRRAKRSREQSEKDTDQQPAMSSKAERKRLVALRTREMAEGAGADKQREVTAVSTGVFRDPKQYIAGTASEATRASDAALDVHAGHKGGVLGASALEANVLDLVGDDARTMASQRRQFHWDARKKRFVQLTATEAAERRGEKRVKTTKGGEIVRSDGKSHGDLYKQWAKKSKKRIGGGDDVDEDGRAASNLSAGGAPLVLSSADYRGGGRVKQRALALSLGATAKQTKHAAVEETRRRVAVARGGADDEEDFGDHHEDGEDSTKLIKPEQGKNIRKSKPTKRELRNPDEIRKLRKEAADHKLKNLPKEKRRGIMAKQKADAIKRREAVRNKAGAGMARSRSLAIKKRRR